MGDGGGGEGEDEFGWLGAVEAGLGPVTRLGGGGPC